MLETDIVIIGAGPAGSIAAREAASNGAKVILIDKKSEIGSPKRCAEGVYDSGLKKLGITPNPRWIAQTIYGGVIHAPNNTDFSLTSEDISMHGYILERKIFDKHMTMDAIRSGAKVFIKTLVTNINRENNGFNVECKNMKKTFSIRTKIVICADGPESTIAKKIGFVTSTPSKYMMSCAQFEMCNVNCYGEDNNIEFFMGNEISPGGYAWIFPKGNGVANVGLGISGDLEKSAYDYLADFVNTQPATKNAQIVEINIGGDPINGLIDKIYDDNVLVCGDAAGQVNPVEGGGIILGMLGGMVAGQIAAKAIHKKDYSKEFLKEYYIEYNKITNNIFEKLPAVRDTIFSLSDKDYNKLIDVANDIDVNNFSKKQILKSILKLPPKLSLKFTKLFKIFF